MNLNNVQGLTAHRNFAKSWYQQRKAMERIETGVRVNAAGDDPAALASSTKLKMQIRGLDKAYRNCEDGISLIRNAEGGLSHINEQLNRMREISLQASNGTLTDEDRDCLEKEFKNCIESIDNIANYTEFNTINVLSPPMVLKDPPPPFSTANLDVVFLIDNSGSMTGNINNVIQGIEGFVDSFKGEINLNVATVNLCDTSNYTKFTNDPEKIKENVRLDAKHGTDPYVAIKESIPTGEIGKNLGYTNNSKKIFIVFTDTGNERQNSSEEEAKNAVEGNNVHMGFDDDDIPVYTFLFESWWSRDTESSFDDIVHSTGGNIYMPKSAEDIKKNLIEDLTTDIKENIPRDDSLYEEGTMKDVFVQKGANANEGVIIPLFDARAKKLGIDELSVSTSEDAKKALNNIDAALQMVSRQRSIFGAYESRLDINIRSVEDLGINLSESDSRIINADIAKEFANMGIANILNSSSQIMMTQSIRISEKISTILENWK